MRKRRLNGIQETLGSNPGTTTLLLLSSHSRTGSDFRAKPKIPFAHQLLETFTSQGCRAPGRTSIQASGLSPATTSRESAASDKIPILVLTQTVATTTWTSSEAGEEFRSLH